MGFVDAVKTALLVKYIDFSGRARRSEFWWFFLFSSLVGVAFNILSLILGGIPVLGTLIAVISGVAGLALMVPGIAVYIRRMHDIGKNGPFLLLILVPIVNFYILYLAAQPGVEGSNEFGSDPKLT